jgi:rubrerythrin
MAEYIEREKLAKALKIWQNTLIENYGENDEYVRCLDAVLLGVDNAPAADVAPVVRSRWREREDRYYGWNVWECMNCHEEFILEEGTPVDNEYKFCPNCGAMMEES